MKLLYSWHVCTKASSNIPLGEQKSWVKIYILVCALGDMFDDEGLPEG